jgi:hypothetical protein
VNKYGKATLLCSSTVGSATVSRLPKTSNSAQHQPAYFIYFIYFICLGPMICLLPPMAMPLPAELPLFMLSPPV